MSLINRKALIAAIKAQRGCFLANNNGRGGKACYIEDLLDLIEDQPTVERLVCIPATELRPNVDTVPVVRGRWISWEKAENCIPAPDRHECSVCHDAAQVLVNGLELLSDYCPNCGARMED